ncbi:hypothetical protein B0H14DRAFT_2648649 [Mycena olivaceomarginata]|nr:hypothetical protein B0H14DRAFT_2648649 [Mycena olivaceomarginata]
MKLFTHNRFDSNDDPKLGDASKDQTLTCGPSPSSARYCIQRNFCPHGSFPGTVRTNLAPTRRIRHRGQKELVVGEELEGITIRYTQAKSRTSKKFEGVARNKSIFGACDTRHEKRLTPVFKVSAGNSRVKIIQLQVSAQNALKCSGHSETPGNVPWGVTNPFRAQNGGVPSVMARVNGVCSRTLFQPSSARYCIQRNFCPHGSFPDTVRTNLTPTRRIRHRGQKELVVGEELEGITIRYTQAKSRTSKKFEGVARNKSIFGACDTRHEKRLTPVFKVSAGNSRVKIIQLQVSAQNALKCSGHSETPGNVPWGVTNPFRAQNGGVPSVMARVNDVLPHTLFQPSLAPYCIQASRLARKNIEHQSPKLCSAWDRELKREQQKAKKRERMARYRARLKDMPAEEREEVYERARMARARYWVNHRLELRLQARSLRASQYEATYGPEAYEAKLERKRLKKLEDEGRRRRAVRPRVPESPKKGCRPQPELAASLLDGNSGKGGA